MTILLIVVAVWFASAWVMLRIGAHHGREISANAMDGALFFGPLGFGILAWARYEDSINRRIRRVLRWLGKPRRWVIRYWPTRTLVIEVSRWELTVTHFAGPRAT